MKNIELYPLRFKEIFKPYIWGGQNLKKLGKPIKNGEIVAESWEISDHNDDISIVENGPLAGKSLRELVETYGEDISPRTENGRFPILIKYIDANKRLSVQVHPDDNYAKAHESPTELGKTECWYIMEAPPGAELIMGIKKGIDKEKFIELIKEKRIEDGLNRIKVEKGDFIYIKTGTVHALLEGIMVCEIQENSDTTYRLYDWGRLGKDGKPRPLHIDKALDVINFPPKSNEEYDRYIQSLLINYDKNKINSPQKLVRSRFFNIDFLKYTTKFSLSTENSHFNILNIIDGSGEIIYRGGTLPIVTGDTILIPRPVREYEINTNEITILKTFL